MEMFQFSQHFLEFFYYNESIENEKILLRFCVLKIWFVFLAFCI